jgi:hypothetical protein
MMPDDQCGFVLEGLLGIARSVTVKNPTHGVFEVQFANELPVSSGVFITLDFKRAL